MSENRSYTFTANPNGVTSAFDKIKASGNTMYSDLIKDAQRYSKVASQQEKILREAEKNLRSQSRTAYEEDRQAIRQQREESYQAMREKINLMKSRGQSSKVEGFTKDESKNIEERYRYANKENTNLHRERTFEASQISELISSSREAARNTINAAKQNTISLADKIKELESSDSEGDRMVAATIREELKNKGVSEGLSSKDLEYFQDKKVEKQEDNRGVESVIGALTQSRRLTAITSAAQGFVRSNDGSDILRSAVDLTANLGGMITQSLSSALPGVGKLLAPVFGEMAEGGLKVLGEASMRTYEERNKLEGAIFSYSAATGSNVDSSGYRNLISSTLKNSPNDKLQKAKEKIAEEDFGLYDSIMANTSSSAKQKLLKERSARVSDTTAAESMISQNQNSGIFNDLEKIGITFEKYQREQLIAARTAGSKRDDVNITRTALTAEKGLGVDKNITYSLVEIQRNTGKDIATTIGGVLNRGQSSYFSGGDRTFLPEFLQKFSQFQRTLLSSSSKVSDAETYNRLEMFNKIGGQFDTKDFRSMGNINSINEGLSKPKNDVFDAMSWNVLRGIFPNKDSSELLEIREGGIKNAEYFKGMVGNIMGSTTDKSSKIGGISGLFGLNTSASREIFDNWDTIKNYSDKEFSSGKFGSAFMEDEASKYTTLNQKNEASIENAFVRGATDGMLKVGESMVAAIKQAFSGATINVSNGYLRLDRGSPLENVPVNPGGKKATTTRYTPSYAPKSLWELENR
jgi:hypothetical protein